MIDQPQIELTPPDISAYRHGNTGIDYVTTLDSGQPGPHAVINALVHGNELCGAIAIDALFHMGVRPRRGRLTLCLANVAAYQAFDPKAPYASRFMEEDFNRLWTAEVLDSRRDTIDLQRARQLRPLYDGADVLLDLHSMTNDGEPLILSGRTERARTLARALGHPAWIVADSGHAAGRRLIDYDRFAGEPGSPTAILVECGQHWRAETAVVAVEASLRFLLALGMVDPDLAAPHLRPRHGVPRVVVVSDAVTAETDTFTFAAPFHGLESLAAGTLIATDGDRRVVAPYDGCILIMPARRVRQGQTAVRLGRVED
ncbi:succinylglutamate desuccinylase/aspartoacylase domain-containing protein [Azospirillum halopraeferens]|uniref:succinylglutamate desuccinylase/aspartoacylase domain-containing protein n=1 Tax=Azospirillum halopraeferens TaxID=34010 RepID=UPI000424AF53|nr:succinylglutamate desuccinylase/aspartoacylase family protein [Azospirillum halopraeferens]